MDSYTVLAKYYDELTCDVDYDKWAKYFIKLFGKHGTRVETVLDLACGTGALSFSLSDKGFDVIGVDASGDMLSIAYQKSTQHEIAPLFLQQDMRELDLYGTVDAAVSCLDSLNYLTSYDSIDTTLSRLKNFIRPGGLFVFDLNTDEKFRSISGEAFIRETERVFCVWSADYDADTRLCSMQLDLFNRCGALWERTSEEHAEYAHMDADIRKALENNRFEVLAVYDEFSFNPPKAESHRIFYVARRKE